MTRKESRFDPAKLAEGIALELPGAHIVSMKVNPDAICLVHITSRVNFHDPAVWIDGKYCGKYVEYSLEWHECAERWNCTELTSLEEYRSQGAEPKRC